MKVVHLLRKPCSEGTVAANVLRHGTGALNVDATRIGTTDNLNGGAYAKNASERHDKAENWRYKRGDRGGLAGTPFTQPTGRWPANLVLQHLDGCVQDGVKKVKAMGATGSRYAGTEGPANIDPGDAPLARRAWVSEDGTETVTAWVCAPGCPVAGLDAQSGVTTSRASEANYSISANNNPCRVTRNIKSGVHFSDTGGASRFFKQVGGVTKPPTDG